MAAEFYDPSDDELARTVYKSAAGRDPRQNPMRAYTSLERQVYSDETEEQMARRIFRQALPNAAAGIVDIATNSTNDRTRLTACQYIVERNLGKVGDDAAFAGENALATFVQGIEESLKNEAK